MWRGTPPNEHTAAWGAHACGAEFHHNDDRGGDDVDDDVPFLYLSTPYIWLTADDEQDKDVEKSCNVEQQRM